MLASLKQFHLFRNGPTKNVTNVSLISFGNNISKPVITENQWRLSIGLSLAVDLEACRTEIYKTL
jgi:hypothetical protein